MPQVLAVIAVVAAVFPWSIILLLLLACGRMWIRALSGGVHMSMFELLGMHLRRRVPAKLIVDVLIQIRRAGVGVPRSYLEAHYVASRSAGTENVSLLGKVLVMAHQNGVAIPHRSLGAHQLAGGDIERVVTGLIAAKRAGLEDAFSHICAVDLAGEDVLQAVSRAAETVRLEDLEPRTRDCRQPGARPSG